MMKKYYDVSDAPLKFHYFFWYVSIPLGALLLIAYLMGDFAYLSDSAYSDVSLLFEIEIFFLLAELILRVICFVGFFKWSKDAWYSLMSLLSLKIIYSILVPIMFVAYFHMLVESVLIRSIGATIFSILVGIYYLKRKPLFFDDIFPTLPVQNTVPQKTKKQKKDKPPKEPKIRYCKLCSGLIDSDTKKCTSCGKQYFKIKITKNIIVVSALSFVIAALGGLNIWQCVDRINAQSEIDSLNKTVSSKQQSISNLVEENNALQGKIQALEGEKKGIASDFLTKKALERQLALEQKYNITNVE